MDKSLRDRLVESPLLNHVNPDNLLKETSDILVLTGEYDFVTTRRVKREELGVRYILARGKRVTYMDCWR